jgi:hypothetical protein
MEGYMKPEVKQMWLEALRSGKYKQGKHQLRSGNKFCCLGVLCEVSGMPYSSYATDLPGDIADWAEIVTDPFVIDAIPEEKLKGMYPLLSNINDSLPGYGFKRIANLIERYL